MLLDLRLILGCGMEQGGGVGAERWGEIGCEIFFRWAQIGHVSTAVCTRMIAEPSADLTLWMSMSRMQWEIFAGGILGLVLCALRISTGIPVDFLDQIRAILAPRPNLPKAGGIV